MHDLKTQQNLDSNVDVLILKSRIIMFILAIWRQRIRVCF